MTTGHMHTFLEPRLSHNNQQDNNCALFFEILIALLAEIRQNAKQKTHFSVTKFSAFIIFNKHTLLISVLSRYDFTIVFSFVRCFLWASHQKCY